jgi:hypothetical protein
MFLPLSNIVLLTNTYCCFPLELPGYVTGEYRQVQRLRQPRRVRQGEFPSSHQGAGREQRHLGRRRLPAHHGPAVRRRAPLAAEGAGCAGGCGRLLRRAENPHRVNLAIVGATVCV